MDKSYIGCATGQKNETHYHFSSNGADAAIHYAEQGGGLTRVLAYQAADGIRRGARSVIPPSSGEMKKMMAIEMAETFP